MGNFLSKFLFFLNKPRVIAVTGENKSEIVKALTQLLARKFKVKKVLNAKLPIVQKNEVLLLKEIKDVKMFSFLARNSKSFTLVVNEPALSDYVFSLIKKLPPESNLIFSFDGENRKEVENSGSFNIITFGLQEKADFKATDVIFNGRTNFKINYKGNIVPVWLNKICDKGEIQASLAAACVGAVLNLNLVEISQSFQK